MKDDFKKSFLNDIKKIKNKKLLVKIKDVIKAVESAQNMQDIPDLKKLKGSRKGIYYRIKIDDYRIGVSIENEMVTFVVFGARKDIYKHFPS
ncbi:MAG: type II toxin-antitoxin system RelE/ParE family toxin [Candidatus Symbiothrix sp.]|jgi:mRNA interferase RelE/StbE|nr:type II toxin-antitoxin system RelE/ParE family toxin [Candidatus Symbiothrix sp.]